NHTLESPSWRRREEKAATESSAAATSAAGAELRRYRPGGFSPLSESKASARFNFFISLHLLHWRRPLRFCGGACRPARTKLRTGNSDCLLN
uniref:Uncharacterized protein n=1 Tax=Oryza barthii TaxID=65489 RepID=A0A0D3H8E2_9ORYZ